MFFFSIEKYITYVLKYEAKSIYLKCGYDCHGGSLEKVCKKLWEVELKLDELKDAFVGSEFSQDEAREYASLFADLETSFSKIIVFIAKKKGITHLPAVLTGEDVMKILLLEPQEARKVFAEEYMSWMMKQKRKKNSP